MKKTIHKIKDILTWFFILVSTVMVLFTMISVNTLDETGRSFFGYKAFIVLSDSMSKSDINAGDLVLIKETDPSTLKEGDIISYISTNSENYGQTITHKIRRLTTDENGNLGFITYGTTTGSDDEEVVLHENVVGKYKVVFPKLGHFFALLKSPVGYITLIMVPFMILMLAELATFITALNRYNKEKSDRKIKAKNKEKYI